MTGATATATYPRKNRRRPSRGIGSTAGFLALSLSVYAVVGVLWGLLRPGYEATVDDAGAVSLVPAFNVEFTAFITFVVATGLLGALLALVMFVSSPHTRGPLMLLWVTVCTFFGAVVFFSAGNVVTHLIHPVPDLENVEPGSSMTLVPGITAGIGLAAAPFMASLAYWCAVLVSPPETGTDQSPAMF